MRFYEVRKTLDASPDALWQILTDARRLQQGMGIQKIEGTIAPGNRIRLWSEAAPGRAFPLRVAVMEAPRRMVWTGGMPLGLFTGTRSFTLRPLTGSQTEFTLREDYSGLLAGLIFPSIPDLTPSFYQFAEGLQKAAQA